MVEPNIGMMEGAYFVSKNDILNWLNDLLKLNLTKIEQLGSGAVWCQVMDVLFPGKARLKQVKWQARQEWEFLHNFKILQNIFTDLKFKKYIEVERLSKARYQDNLEFAQWFKKLYDLNNGSGINYNAEERRGNVQTDFGFAEKQVLVKTFNPQGQAQVQPTPEKLQGAPLKIKKPKPEDQAEQQQQKEEKKAPAKKEPVQKQPATTTTTKKPITSKAQPTTGGAGNKNQNSELETKLEALKQQNLVLKKCFQEIHTIIHSEIQMPQQQGQNEQQAQIQIANFKLDKINGLVSKILNIKQQQIAQSHQKQGQPSQKQQQAEEEEKEQEELEQQQMDDQEEVEQEGEGEQEQQQEDEQQGGDEEEEQQQQDEEEQNNENNHSGQKKHHEDEDLI